MSNLSDRLMGKVEQAAEKLVAEEGQLSPRQFEQRRNEFEVIVGIWLRDHGVEAGPRFLEIIVAGAIGAARMARAQKGGQGK